MDATYWGKSFGVLLIVDAYRKRLLWRKFLDKKETIADYIEGIEWLREHKFKILGIVCDGEGYYNLKTARDREIVQPSVLKQLGWELMHVWALDWFMHPEMVTKNILERLQNIK